MPRRKQILLYKTGQTSEELIRHIGDYELWFQRVMGDGVEIEVHLAFTEPRHHRLASYDGLVITGSPRSLVRPEPWMDEAAETVRQSAAAGVPTLGVCFGHQLIGYAFGGRVRQNPNGWEVGTVEVELTGEGRRDPLFEGLPERIFVNESHRDEVCELGEARRLAQGARTANQAIAVGEHVRGVQFHPEMDGVVIRRLIEFRREILSRDAEERAIGESVDQMLARSGDTPQAEQVLRNFVEYFVR
jgi:GMP synthase (glutamine-hydrolysing)